jgi:hypothetical protein
MSWWIEQSDSLLRKRYGISLEEAGVTHDEFAAWYEGVSPILAVESFADKYDLEPLGFWS